MSKVLLYLASKNKLFHQSCPQLSTSSPPSGRLFLVGNNNNIRSTATLLRRAHSEINHSHLDTAQGHFDFSHQLPISYWAIILLSASLEMIVPHQAITLTTSP